MEDTPHIHPSPHPHRPLLIITGPTASGKTGRAVHLARALDGEIISADSRQIYRGMDLGTGKDLEEYGTVPYHLIDICPAGYRYNLYEYMRDYREAETLVRSHGCQPIVCGGTGLYVESIAGDIHLPQVPPDPVLRQRLQGLDLQQLTHMLQQMKTLHNTTDTDTPQRAIRAIEIATYYRQHPDQQALTQPRGQRPDCHIFVVDIDRDTRRSRITARLQQRLDQGMNHEVRTLLDNGIAPENLIYYGLEYKFLTLYVTGQMTRGEMFTALETAIHRFAKRQMTWLRGMERRGYTLHHIDHRLDPDSFNNTVMDIAGIERP